MKSAPAKGFSLIELMVVIVIVAILATIAIPAVGDYVTKRRLIGAAEAIYGQLQLARSLSISRNQPIFVMFDADGGTTWRVGIGDFSNCDPGDDITPTYSGVPCTTHLDPTIDPTGPSNPDYTADTSKLVLHRLDGSDFTDIEMAAPSFFGSGPGDETEFEPQRGTAENGTVTISNDAGEVRITLNRVGRIMLCSPAGTDKLTNYGDCS